MKKIISLVTCVAVLFTALSVSVFNSSVSVSAGTSPTVVESGLCAVGRIANGKAVILTPNGGAAETVAISGGAPISGTVNNYKLYSDGSYELTEHIFNRGGYGNASGLSNDFWWAALSDNPSQLSVGGYTAEFADDIVIFIRYSETEWRMLTGADALVVNPADSYFAFSTTPDNEIKVMLLGDYNNGYNEPELRCTAPFDPNGIGWAAGDVSLDGAVESGLCAVGRIANGKAVILTPNGGAAETVAISGGNPVSGTVNNYTLYSDGYYELTEHIFNRGGGSVSGLENDDNQFWWVGLSPPLDPVPSKLLNYEFADDIVIFFRYSATEWRMLTGEDASVKISGNTKSVYTTTSDDKVKVMLIGDYEGKYMEGSIIPPSSESTAPFDEGGIDWATGNIFLDSLIVPGDVNFDGRVDVSDLISIKKHIISDKILTGSVFFAADVNGDGKVDATDIILTKKIILKID